MFSYIVLGVLVVFLIYTLSHFRPINTQKINENAYAVRCGIGNFYAYNAGSEIILFDTGINPSVAKNGLKKLGLSNDMVKTIFLTHSDFDHIGGIDAFPDADVYISKMEEQMITGQTPRRFFVYNRHLSKYNVMTNNEIKNINGNEIRICETPGHTAGSASYIINNTIMISGDLLNISRDKKIKPFLFLMNMNHKKDIESIKTMENEIKNIEYIFTGHTGIYKNK